MVRNNGFLSLLSVVVAIGGGCSQSGPPVEHAAASIIEKNVAARGGLEAWRAVHTMSMSGSIDAGKATNPASARVAMQRSAGRTSAERRLAVLESGKEETGKTVQLPFVLEMERPRKARLEIQFDGQTAVQVFDGTNGWKLRPFLGRHEVEVYTTEERQAAAEQQDLDGPLIDYAAKGNTVELEGTEQVEGRDTYKLKLTLKDGQVRHVWIDAQTFLDSKMEGSPRRLDGKYHPVETYFRDYRSVDGLMIPYVVETRVQGVEGSERISVERVVVNPKLGASRFTRPD